MEARGPRISLAKVFLAVTILGITFACLRTEVGRVFVLPIAVAFFSGFLFPYGVRVGSALAGLIVVVNAVLLEKDPSGLGPNEVVIPFHLVVFAIPVLVSAWLGSVIRSEISSRDAT